MNVRTFNVATKRFMPWEKSKSIYRFNIDQDLTPWGVINPVVSAILKGAKGSVLDSEPLAIDHVIGACGPGAIIIR